MIIKHEPTWTRMHDAIGRNVENETFHSIAGKTKANIMKCWSTEGVEASLALVFARVKCEYMSAQNLLWVYPCGLWVQLSFNNNQNNLISLPAHPVLSTPDTRWSFRYDNAPRCIVVAFVMYTTAGHQRTLCAFSSCFFAPSSVILGLIMRILSNT